MDLSPSPKKSAAKPALGIYTKSHSTPENIRFQRFALQAESRKLLPKERVSTCIYRRITKGGGIKLLYNTNRKKANYGNVARCGSGWVCPVCASIISERRKNELMDAVNVHQMNGGSVLLLTLTNSHNASHSLRFLKDGQRKAMKYFFGNRRSQAIFEGIQKVGHVNAYEVTHGANGWHPHHHILLFINGFLTNKEMELYRDLLAEFWIECCRKSKLPLPDMRHGLDLQDGSYAEKYISKWGLGDEMTKGHIKKGREGGKTPFDLLKASALGDEEAGRLFQEFAIVFKGSRQLTWSRGLKKMLLQDEELTDQQIVDDTEKESIQDYEFNIVQWHAICNQDKRACILSAAEQDRTLKKMHELLNYCILAEIDRLSTVMS